MKKKVILGGGVAGLIYAFYNKEYFVISPEFGGQMINQFPLGPRFLHMNEFSEKLLRGLEMPIEDIEVKTGYMLDSGVILDQIPHEQFKEDYFMKSRGKKDLAGYDKTVMSEGKNRFVALKVDFNEMIGLLCHKLNGRLITGKVERIDTRARTLIVDDKIIEYESLVNTIPLNVFGRLVTPGTFPSPDNFKSEAVTYILLQPELASNFDYVYVADPRKVFHRLTFDPKGTIAEWFGVHDAKECQKVFGERYVDSKVLYGAQIIPYLGEIKLEGVKFIGRYGTWKREWKTEKVIEEAIKDGKL